MKRAWGIFKFIVMVVLVLGTLQVFLLSFYLATHDSHDPAGAATGSMWEAARLLVTKSLDLLRSPTAISVQERATLEEYGNSLVLLISVLAVLFSSIAVIDKLAQVGDLLTYEKFEFRFGFLLKIGGVVRNWPDGNQWLEKWQQSIYKNLAVKKMVHCYQSADHLMIVSGNYSWLFDTKWSEQARKSIISKLPNDVCLLSWSSPEELVEHWEGSDKFPMEERRKIFQSMQFVKMGYHCNGSIVKSGNRASYIYLYRETPERSSVCLFHGVREAETLVQIVEDELRRLHEVARSDGDAKALKEKMLKEHKCFVKG